MVYKIWGSLRLALHEMGVPVFGDGATVFDIIFVLVSSAFWVFFFVWTIEGIRYGIRVARHGS